MAVSASFYLTRYLGLPDGMMNATAQYHSDCGVCVLQVALEQPAFRDAVGTDIPAVLHCYDWLHGVRFGSLGSLGSAVLFSSLRLVTDDVSVMLDSWWLAQAVTQAF
jgi:hypothetical protein